MPTTGLFDLSDRVAVVTGGNGGIGRAIALGLARAGAAIAVLVGRLGNPDECAGTAVYLASRASDFVTGATICVDGGYAIHGTGSVRG